MTIESDLKVFHSLSDLPGRELIPGYRGKFIHSATMTAAYWDIQGGNSVPEHSHPHEMIVNILEGEFELTVGGETRRMRGGDVAIVPSNVPHSALAITDCRCVDVFSPPRTEYQN